MIQKIKEVLIIVLLTLSLIIEGSTIIFLCHLFLKGKPQEQVLREAFFSNLDSSKRKFFMSSPLYQKYMNSTRTDSVYYYFRSIDSTYNINRNK